MAWRKSKAGKVSRRGSFKERAKKGLVGPSGAELFKYVHPVIETEKWSEHEGGMVNGYESDWDAAQKCSVCGKEIVHQYYVRLPDKTEIVVGIEHLPQVLGFKRLPKKVIDQAVIALEEKQLQIDYRHDVLDKRVAPTKDEANIRFWQANPAPPGGRDPEFKHVLLQRGENEFIRVASQDDFEYLENKGFRQIWPGEKVELRRYH